MCSLAGRSEENEKHKDVWNPPESDPGMNIASHLPKEVKILENLFQLHFRLLIINMILNEIWNYKHDLLILTLLIKIIII